MHETMANVELITKTEATHLTRLDLKNLNRMIQAGEIREVKMPGGMRSKILKSSVIDFLDRLRAQAQAG